MTRRLNIPEIITNPDEIRLSDKFFQNKPVIRTTVVTYVSRKHHDLTVQTIYSGKDKRSLATTPSGTNSFSQTSETLSGTASIETIPHTSKNSNLSKENNLSGRKSKDDTIFDDFEDEEVMFTADGDIAFDGFGADGGKGDKGSQRHTARRTEL